MGTDAPSPEPLSSVRPPLRILFTIDYGRKVNFLPLSRGGRLYVGFPDATRALDERTAEKLWENEEIESPLLFAEGKLVGQRRTGLDRQVLEVVDPDTGRVERTLVDWPALNYDPAWSPDGTEIAFASNITGEYAIYRQRLSDGRSWRVTHTKGDARYPDYAPR